MVVQLPVLADPPRPRTRAECERGPRPCPWVNCRHHLADVDVHRDGRIEIGELVLRANATEQEVDGFADKLATMLRSMPDTCVLDAARADGLTLEEIGRRLQVTRERIRQIENRATNRMEHAARRGMVDALDDLDRKRGRVQERDAEQR